MNATLMLALLGPLGTTELIVIALVALLLFGGRLPEVMRSMGRGIIEFKRGLKDTQDDIDRHSEPPARENGSGNQKKELTSNK